jgi:hypothetical protein
METYNNAGLATGIISLVYLVSLGIWIWQLVRLSKRKSSLAFALTLVLGLLFIPFVPITAFISLFVGRGEEERENKKEEFWCSICGIKYREELLGGETIREGKICRWCLEKKKKGEK